MTGRSVFDEAPAAWALWRFVVARIPEHETSEFSRLMGEYRDEVRQPNQPQIHASLCGPERGGFRVCYCDQPCCHPVRDGRRVCVCAGCRATPDSAGNRKETP